MSVVFDERDAYLKSPYFKKHEYGDFSAFYVTVSICAVVGISIFILNIVLGCCSRYSEYWNDRHTGNRWIVSFWTATPHNQPPLDYTELQEISIPEQPQVLYHHPTAQQQQPEKVEYHELKKRESDI